LRLRLTAAFASVVAVVLVASGILVYSQFRHYVDVAIDQELAERAVAFRRLAFSEVRPQRIIQLSGEAFAQIYALDGRVLASTREVGGQRLLTSAQLRDAQRGVVRADRPSTAPTKDGVRLRAFEINDAQVAVVAEARDGRELELQRLATLLAVTLPAALLLASLAGYRVAGSALAPVERMRVRAAEIGPDDPERLPKPGTGDELDRLADTLNDLLDRVHGALAHEQRMVGTASHELRTPISVLRTRLDVALRGRHDGETLLATIREARTDAVRLSRLADDLLVLARADQGRLPLRPALIDVQELLSAAAARHQDDAARAQREVTTAVDVPGGAVLLGDPDRLAQVLDNLIVNSLRYGAGTTELVARPSADPARIDLVVSDHGDGFPPDFVAHALDRFSQADAGSGSGSGLGLAIVDAVVQAHGGAVVAGNSAEGSAQVVITLALA
jgi:signal transduction histidine kinase